MRHLAAICALLLAARSAPAQEDPPPPDPGMEAEEDERPLPLPVEEDDGDHPWVSRRSRPDDDRPPAPRDPITGALRAGLYVDGDRTTVFRALGTLGGAIGRLTLSGTASVDVVTSASVDVRSSGALSKVDVVTSASGRSSTTTVEQMSDRRFAGTFSAGYRSNDGRAATASLTVANENDYNSVGAGLSGSFDALHRAVTFLGGASFTYNWIGSVLDRTFAKQMYALGYTLGAAPVLGKSDALRLRYDGVTSNGYQASPYRSVRFGDWTTSIGTGGRILFANTIGSTDGLAETLPDLRVRHALAAEWVHSFSRTVGLFTQARAGIDSWGVKSASGMLELRTASTSWRFRLGYRLYYQTGADFYQSKYLLSSDHYAYFTSDKELSREIGHVAHIGLARVLKQSRAAGDPRLLLDAGVHFLYYNYPDFVLLPSRAAGFVDVGLTWE